jgi:hypothetical protein
MSDFVNMFKASLGKASQAFLSADKDLHDVITRAAEALLKVTNGAADMALGKINEGVDGVSYALSVQTEIDSFEVGGYFVSSKGYPVRYGSIELGDFERVIKPSQVFANKDEIERHLESLVSNPDSPLIVRLAYMLRRVPAHDEET